MSNSVLKLESTYDKLRGFYVDVNLGNYPFMVLCFNKKRKLVCALPNSKFISEDGSKIVNACEYNNLALLSKTNSEGVGYKVIDGSSLTIKDLVTYDGNVVTVKFGGLTSSTRLDESNVVDEEQEEEVVQEEEVKAEQPKGESHEKKQEEKDESPLKSSCSFGHSN